MSYNTSKGVIKRSQAYLDAMLEARRTHSWPADHPFQLAYKIREAMYAVQKYSEYARYHDLREFFRIRPGTGWVEAQYIGPPIGGITTYTPQSMQVSEATDIRHVVGACIKFGVKADELVFPNAQLNVEDLKMLYKWSHKEEHGPIWHIIFHDPGVTMTRRHGVDKLFIWTPEEV